MQTVLRSSAPHQVFQLPYYGGLKEHPKSRESTQLTMLLHTCQVRGTSSQYVCSLQRQTEVEVDPEVEQAAICLHRTSEQSEW